MPSNVATGVPEKQGDWTIDIPSVLEPPIWPECCIYRVPKKLRNVNKRAYTPKLISIGPLHHGGKELREMEMQKRRYLADCCRRTNVRPSDLVFIVEEKEVKIRRCYAEASNLTSKQFVEMIVLDGIFIIELFLRTKENENGKLWESDYILSNPWLKKGIQHDLLLLENQLPIFVLEDLYKSLLDGSSSCNRHTECELMNKEFPSFLELYRHYFSDYYRKRQSVPNEKGEHFTDSLRHLFCARETRLQVCRGPEGAGRELPYSAKQLDEAGVKFKIPKTGQLLDVRFKKQKFMNYFPCLNCSWLLNWFPCLRSLSCLWRMQPFLYLPALEIGQETEFVFRNLMALEQCHYPTEAYICNYILLLDSLIKSENDVDLLVEEKVIVNKLGNHKAVATLVNRLGHQIFVVNSCYSDVSASLKEHYENFWNKNMATLTAAYFRYMWTGTAIFMGAKFLFFIIWNVFLRHFVRMPAAFLSFL